MVYKILETDPIHNTHKFFVDDITDLEILPKEPASTALVANTGDTYICNNNNQWIMYIDNPIENTPDSDDNIDGSGVVMGRLSIPTQNVVAGTYTLNGNEIQFTEVQYNGWTMNEADIPAGSIVIFTPSDEIDHCEIAYYTQEQLELDASPKFAVLTVKPVNNQLIGIPIANGLNTIFHSELLID